MKNCRVHPTHWLISTQVLADYGALQSLLLTPTAAVADRVGRILGRSRCDVGVHLRKADGAQGPSSRPASKLMGGGAGALAASAAAWPRRFVLANADAMAAASPMPPIMV